jgi:hypothetical protein
MKLLNSDDSDEWFDAEEGKGGNPKYFWMSIIITIVIILILLL